MSSIPYSRLPGIIFALWCASLLALLLWFPYFRFSEPEWILREWLNTIPQNQVTIIDRDDDYASALIQISDTNSLPADSFVAAGLRHVPRIQLADKVYRLREDAPENRAIYDPLMSNSEYSVVLAKVNAGKGRHEVVIFVGDTHSIEY